MNIPRGRENIIRIFINSLEKDRLSNSYIICGENGMGKKTLTEYVLALIACDTHKACGKCASCKSLEAGTHPDIVEIRREESKASIGIDSVREVMKQVYIKPVAAYYKAVVVHEAHLLTTEAQNAMLKVIEEPPERTVFFFLCDTVASILPTVISRSVMINLPPLSREVLSDIVNAGDFEMNYCRGNPGALIKLAGDAEFADLRDGVTDAFSAVISRDEYAVFDAVSFFENNKEHREEIISIILFFLRDVMYKKLGMSEYMVNKDKTNHISAFADRISEKGCLKMLNTIIDIQKSKGKNGNYTIAVTMMLLKCREEING